MSRYASTTLSSIANGLKKFRWHGDYRFSVCRPAHNDRNPSFATSVSNGKRLALEDDSSKPDSSTNTATKRSHNCILLQYNAHMLGLLKRELVTEDENPQILRPRPITLSSQAKELWREFHDYCDSASGRGGEYESVRGFANKAPEHSARIAAILTGVSNPDALNIDLDTMRDAIQLTNYYLMEWIRIVGEAGVDPDIRLAEILLEWLKNSGEAFIYPIKIYQYGPSGLRTKKDTMRIMAILEGHGHVIKLGKEMILDSKKRKDVWRII